MGYRESIDPMDSTDPSPSSPFQELEAVSDLLEGRPCTFESGDNSYPSYRKVAIDGRGGLAVRMIGKTLQEYKDNLENFPGLYFGSDHEGRDYFKKKNLQLLGLTIRLNKSKYAKFFGIGISSIVPSNETGRILLLQIDADSDAFDLLTSGRLSPQESHKLIQAIWKFIQDLTTCLKELGMYFFDGKLENIGVKIDENGEYICFLVDIGGLTDRNLLEQGRQPETTAWYQPFFPCKNIANLKEAELRRLEQEAWVLALLAFSLGASCRPGLTMDDKNFYQDQDATVLVEEYTTWLHEVCLLSKRELNLTEEAYVHCFVKLFLNTPGANNVIHTGGTPETRKRCKRARLPLDGIEVNTSQPVGPGSKRPRGNGEEEDNPPNLQPKKLRL